MTEYKPSNKLKFDDIAQARHDEMVLKAKEMNDETLENCMNHLRQFFARSEHEIVIEFRKDFADLSLVWFAYRIIEGKRECFYNGGLIYSSTCGDWSIHT